MMSSNNKMVDVSLNTHPSGAVGTDISGHSTQQMLGPPGVLATNLNRNIESHVFGHSPVQEVTQRGLHQNILDQAFYNSVETTTVQVPTTSTRDTVLFDLKWGNFSRGALRYLAAAHNDCAGDIIHEVRVIGNTLYVGAIVVGWIPTAELPSPLTVESLQRYDYQVLAANMQKNYTFINHTSKLQQFFSTLEATGKVSDSMQVGHLVGLVHTDIQAASGSADSYITLHITERFANPGDMALGAKPFTLNWPRSDAELITILDGGDDSQNNLVDLSTSLYETVAFDVDSTAYYSGVGDKIDMRQNTYSCPTQAIIPPYRTDGDPEAIEYSQAVLTGATENIGLQFLPFAFSRLSDPVSSTVSSSTNMLVTIDKLMGLFLGDISDFILAGSHVKLETVSELESYLITNQGCNYAYTSVVADSVNAATALAYDQTTSIIVDDDIHIRTDPTIMGEYAVTHHEISYTLYITSLTVGVRLDGTRVLVPLIDWSLSKIDNIASIDVPAGARLICETAIENVVDASIVYPFGTRWPFQLYMLGRIRADTGALVISSTLSSGYYQDSLGLKPVRLVSVGYDDNPVSSGLSGAVTMTLSLGLDEILLMQRLKQLYTSRTLLTLGPTTGSVSLQLVFEPSIPALLAKSPEFSRLSLTRDNLYILSAVAVGPTTIPEQYAVWESRIAPTVLSKVQFSALTQAIHDMKISRKLPIYRGIVHATSEMEAALLAGGALSGIGSGFGAIAEKRFLAEQAGYQREFLGTQSQLQRDFLGEQAQLNRRQQELNREQQMRALFTNANLSGGRASAYSGVNTYHPMMEDQNTVITPNRPTEIVHAGDVVPPEVSSAGTQADLGQEASTQTINTRPYSVGTIITPGSNLKALSKSFVPSSSGPMLPNTLPSVAGSTTNNTNTSLPSMAGNVLPTMTQQGLHPLVGAASDVATSTSAMLDTALNTN